MKPHLFVFEDKEKLARSVADQLLKTAQQAAGERRKINVALSGGSTPKTLFQILAEVPYQTGIHWENVRLLWGDERCVPPDHPDSNYGMTKSALLDHITIPPENIQRIRGEVDPQEEAGRYSGILREYLPPNKNGIPRFDWIFLGMGTDGHSASLFPGSENLTESKKLCVVATHPESGQQRISLTLPVLNAAEKVSFLVTGKDKVAMVDMILNRKEGFRNLPAAMVQPADGTLEWYMDQAAAARLDLQV